MSQRTMVRSLFFAAVGLLVLIAAVRWPWSNATAETGTDATSPPTDDSLVGPASSAGFGVSSGYGPAVHALIASDDYYSGLTVLSSAFPVAPGQDANDDTIIRRERERDPATQDFVSHQRVFSVSYDIVGVFQRTPSDIFIAGALDTGGEFVIERWTFRKIRGAYHASRPEATTLGTPFTTPPTTIEIVGGTFVQPELRNARPPLRKIIYQGTFMGPIRGLGVDPDGRFVLVLSGVAPATAVYRIALTFFSTPEPVLLYDSTTFPELTNNTRITPFDHNTLGRILVASAIDQPWVVVLYDVLNDGLIDSEVHFTVDDFADSGIPGGVVRDFVETYN